MCASLHPRFEFIVRSLQQVFGPSSMQEEQQGQPYRRQAEQPTGDAHPQWYSIERGLQHDIGHVDRGANDRRDQWAFPIWQEKGQNDESTVEHRIPGSQRKIYIEDEDADAQTDDKDQQPAGGMVTLCIPFTIHGLHQFTLSGLRTRQLN
jgi:hypothetical protein